jgi:hypothetical protein
MILVYKVSRDLYAQDETGSWEASMEGFEASAPTPLAALSRLATKVSRALGDDASVELIGDLRATEDFRLEGIHPPWAATALDLEATGQDPAHAMYSLCLMLEKRFEEDGSIPT